MFGLIRFDFKQGEYSVELTRLIETGEGCTLEAGTHDYLMNYYGEEQTKYLEDVDYYEVNGGEAIIELVEIKELSEKEHSMLRQYIRV